MVCKGKGPTVCRGALRDEEKRKERSAKLHPGTVESINERRGRRRGVVEARNMGEKGIHQLPPTSSTFKRP